MNFDFYYLDSSALIKRYVEEIGSAWVRRLLKPGADKLLITSRLTMDAVQLASALVVLRALSQVGLPAPIFLSADDRLLRVANAEGLAVDNPNLHP